MDQWVLKAVCEPRQILSDGFYTGESYIYQGSKYAVVDRDINRAKYYSSERRALEALDKLAFENYIFEVKMKDDFG